MIEQDYIMRLIKEMVRALLKLFFGIDTAAPTAELLEKSEQRETLHILLDLADTGMINEAENRLYDLISAKTKDVLEIAVLFYSCLNEKSDDFLAENDFSREEIIEGLKNIISEYELDGLEDVFKECLGLS